jgi:hypothetical protein
VNLDRGVAINGVFNAKTQRKYQFKKQSEKVAPFTGKQEQSESLMNCFKKILCVLCVFAFNQCVVTFPLDRVA